MAINQIKSAESLNYSELLKSVSNKSNKKTVGMNQERNSEDSFSKMLQTSDSEKTYSSLKMDVNALAVEKLMNESDDIQSSVEKLISDLLERQGISIDQLKKGKVDELKVDDIAVAEAQKMIGPGGELSPEKVSDRIVDFAIAAMGGDKSKIGIIRDSIDKGFAQAQKILGGELPEISKNTYDLIQEKLDNWLNEDKPQNTESTPTE